MDTNNVMIYVARKSAPNVIVNGLSLYNSKSAVLKDPETLNDMVDVVLAYQATHCSETDLFPVAWDLYKTPARNCEKPRELGQAALEAGRQFIYNTEMRTWTATVKFSAVDKAEVKKDPKQRTIFTTSGFNAGAVAGRGETLQDLLNFVISKGFTPTAWAEEGIKGYGGTKPQEELEAESVAAGRLIKKADDGSWVMLGQNIMGKMFDKVKADVAKELKEDRHINVGVELPDGDLVTSSHPADIAMVRKDGPAKVQWKPKNLRLASTCSEVKDPAPTFFGNLLKFNFGPRG